MFITKVSPPILSSAALNNRFIASSKVKKNRVILKSVIVIGPPALICSIKYGITLPFDPMTFPPRIHTNFVCSLRSFACMITFSPTDLVMPYKLIGSTALSVDTSMTFLTLFKIHALTILLVPIIFVFIASWGWSSQIGTCFNAAI